MHYSKQNCGVRIPSYLSVEIVTRGDSKFVIIHSSIHQNKHTELSHSYALSFSDDAILRDSDFLRHLARFV